MFKSVNSIRKSYASLKRYFSECSKEIAIRNINLLHSVCCAFIIVFCLYYCVTSLFFPQNGFSVGYCYIIPLLIPVLIYIKINNKHDFSEAYINVKPKRIKYLALYVYIMLMIYMIIISVFPHPDIPSVFFHLFLVVSPLMFIVPIIYQLAISTISYAVFFALVIIFKSPACWSHELFEVTTALIFSIVVIVLTMQFRIQSDVLKNKYYALSRMDTLTGVLNKAAGTENITAYINKSHDEKMAVLFIDIDNFKMINDSLGHSVGDAVLEAFGTKLRSVFKSGDILCRFGGDEFVVLMKNLKSPDAAGNAAKRIIDETPAMFKKHKNNITCSVGICTFHSKDINVDSIMCEADDALYKAKKNGKNQYYIITKN